MAQAQPQWKDLLDALESVRGEWDGLLTHAKLKFDAEREWVLQSCEKNDYAKGLALSNIDAVVSALRNVASVGVTLDPAQKLAYVLPRDKKMVYDLSYMGMAHIAMRSGSILWAQAHLVYESEVKDFLLMGYDEAPKHRRNPFATPEERGQVAGAYVVVKTASNDYLTNVMPIGDIHAIRDRSPSWKKDKSGPWKTDFAEMAKKTVVKQAYKYWPRSEHLDRAIHYLNTEGGQGIDLTPEDESKTRQQLWLEKVNAATDGPTLQKVWKDAFADFKTAEDPDGAKVVQQRVLARAEEFKAKPAPSAAPKADPNATRAITPQEREVAALTHDIAQANADTDWAALGARIDALPADVQVALNTAYNARIDALQAEGAQA